MTAGFCCEVNEIRVNLGYYAAQNGNSVATFRNNLSAPYSRIKQSKKKKKKEKEKKKKKKKKKKMEKKKKKEMEKKNKKKKRRKEEKEDERRKKKKKKKTKKKKKKQEKKKKNCLTLKDGIDRLSRNVGTVLSSLSTQYPSTAQSHVQLCTFIGRV